MRRVLRALIIILFALASTLALMMVNADLTTSTCFLFFLRDCLHILSGQEAAATLVMALLVWFFHRTVFTPYAWQRGDRIKLGILSAFFAFSVALGAVSRADDGILATFLTPYHLLFLAGKGAGYFVLFFFGMKGLLLAMPRMASKLQFPPSPAETRVLRRTFLLSWLLLLCAWLPALLARYPGAVTADAGRALQQFTGEIMPTSDHPQAYTYLLGGIVWLGSRLGSDNAGIFTFIALQMLFLSGVMAWSLAELRRESVPRVFILSLLGLYALSPLTAQYAAVVIKDIPYSAAALGFTLCISKAFLHPLEMWQSRKWWLGFSVYALLLVLIRHNGIMVVLPSTLALGVRFYHSRKSTKKNRQPLFYTLLALPLIVMLLFENLIVPQIAYKVEPSADVLGVAIQQTARILKNAPQDVTQEELTAIDSIWEADQLADAYTPRGSDATRKLFRYFNGHTAVDVRRFTRVWLRLAAAHPLTSLQAFWSLSGGFFDPFDTAFLPYEKMEPQSSIKYPHDLSMQHPDSLTAMQDRLLSLESSYRSFPGVSILKNIGLYTWLMLIGWFLIRRVRQKQWVWLLLPPLMTLLICLFSAGFAIGTRYALPIVYTLPWLLCLFTGPILKGAQNPAKLQFTQPR